VRPENPVLVPFDWTTATVWIVQKQTVVLNVTDGGTDLKSRANNVSSNSTEARRHAYAWKFQERGVGTKTGISTWMGDWGGSSLFQALGQ